MNGYQKQLATAADPAQVVGKSNSQVPYLGVPVSKDAYPQDIAAKIDSMAVGTTGVFESKADNTLNIIRLISKQELPDSVQYRQIQVTANTPDEAVQRPTASPRLSPAVPNLRMSPSVMASRVSRLGSPERCMRVLRR